MGFLIFDEAAGYIQIVDKTVEVRPGAEARGIPHLHFRDRNLVECFMNADVDYIIWFTPYKNIPGNKNIYPLISVFDMKRQEIWEKKLTRYDANEMVCLEAREEMQ